MELQETRNEIFIIDEELVQEFMDEDNSYRAEIFFVYLSSWCSYNRAYMIPSLHKKIKQWMRDNTKDIDEFIKTKVVAQFENWVEEADLLGEDSIGTEEHDTELLIKLLKLLHPRNEIVVVSSKYIDHPQIKSMDSEELYHYIIEDKEFLNFFEKKYNLGDYESHY